MGAILVREIDAYYKTMIGYVFTSICLLVGGILFVTSNIVAGSASFISVIGSISYVFILVIPLLTMRLFAEERKNKSDQLLLTAPISVGKIVMGKFFAAVMVMLIALAITLIYPLILLIFGEPYIGEIVLGYLGLILLGGAFLSVGIFISSVTENQLTASVATMGILFFLWLMDSLVGRISNPALSAFVSSLSLYQKFSEFQMGVLSLSSVVYFLTFISLFLFLTIKVIEARRWGKQ